MSRGGRPAASGATPHSLSRRHIRCAQQNAGRTGANAHRERQGSDREHARHPHHKQCIVKCSVMVENHAPCARASCNELSSFLE